VSTCNEEGGYVLRAHDLKTGRETAQFPLRSYPNLNYQFWFSGDGRMAAFEQQEGGRNRMVVWPFAEGKERTELSLNLSVPYGSNHVALTRDRLLVSGMATSPGMSAPELAALSAVGQLGGAPVLWQPAWSAGWTITRPLPARRSSYAAQCWDINTGKPIGADTGKSSMYFELSEKYAKALAIQQGYPAPQCDVWDSKSGRKIAALGDTFRELSPDRRFVIFSSGKLLDLATMMTRALLAGSDSRGYKFTPDSRSLIVLSLANDRGDSVRVFDLHDPARHWSTSEQFVMPLVEVSPDSRLIGLIDRTSADQMHLYSRATGWKIQTILIRRGNYRPDRMSGIEGASRPAGPPGRRRVVAAAPRVSFSPDGKSFSVMASHQLYLGKTDQPQVYTALPRVSHQGAVHTVAVSPDSRFLASAGTDGTVCFWRTHDGRFLGMLDEGGAGPSAIIRRIVFSPRGNLLALRKEGGEIVVWKWSRSAGEDDEIATTFLWSNARDQGGPLAFSPVGMYLAAGDAGGGIRVFHTETGKIAQWLSPQPLDKDNAVQGLAFTPDGRFLAVARSSIVALWDVNAGSLRRAWDAQQGPIQDLTVSQDGRLIVTTGKDVRLWNATTGELQLTLERQSSTIRRATFSPSGGRLAVVDDRSVVVTGVADLLTALDSLGLGSTGVMVLPPEQTTPLWHLQMQEKIANENIVIEHLPKAASAERAKDWQQAIAHLTRLLEVEPKNQSWRMRRLTANEQRKDWKKVAEDRSFLLDDLPDDRSSGSARRNSLHQLYHEQPEVYAALEKLRTNDPLPALVRGRELVLQSKWPEAKSAYESVIRAMPAAEEWYEYAALCLLSGDRKAYLDHIAWMTRQKGQPANEFLCYCYARAAALIADPGVETTRAVKWAEVAVAKGKSPGHLHAAGLAYYRAGQLDKARDTFREALKGSWVGQVLNQLALGMVEHKLGKDKAARELLDAARKWQQAVERAKKDGYVNVMIPDWVEFNVLMPELEALLAKGAAANEPATKP
jgi:WD40 repeat protein